MTSQELHSKIQNQDPIIILDVREHFELDICKLNGSIHIPMGQIASNYSSLPKDQNIVVICHHGVRSLQVVNFMKQNGYTNIYNLEGGIHNWAQTIDKSMDTY